MSDFLEENITPDQEAIYPGDMGFSDQAEQRSIASHNGEKRSRTPPPSSEAARQRMRATRQHGTKPEVALRGALNQLGIVYHVDQSPVSGLKSRPDLIFEDTRIAVYVDGCFWHSCPIHGTLPKSNRQWWQAKLEANRQRDAKANDVLASAGWYVVRVWEHADPITVAKELADLIAQRQIHQPES